MKNKIFIGIGVFILLVAIHAGQVWGAPTYSVMRSIYPETSSTYTIGTSTRPWLSGTYVDLFDASGNKFTTSTGSGSVSTSSPGLTLGQWVIAASNSSIYSTSSQPGLVFQASSSNVIVSGPSASGTVLYEFKSNPTFGNVSASSVSSTNVDATGYIKINGDKVSTSTGATPAGSNTQIQYNEGGALGADSNLTYTSSTKQQALNHTSSSILIGAKFGNFNTASSTGMSTFHYTGTVASYTVPAGVTALTINAVGAPGSTAGVGVAGKGGSATGTINVVAGQTYYYVVGQIGQQNGTAFGGGGWGGASTPNGGGGMTWFGTANNTSTPNTMLLIAGGGGGATQTNGGDGGYPSGGNGTGNGTAGAGTGGSQSAGGTGGTGATCNGTNGGSLVGGNGCTLVTDRGTGGGGGYYGGGGGSSSAGVGDGGGGGGSSYASSTTVYNSSFQTGGNSTSSLSITTYVNTTSSDIGSSVYSLAVGGHILTGGTSPTLSSCGAGPTISGSDTAGLITVNGTSTTSCTLTFRQPWVNLPACVATDNTNILALKALQTTSTLTISASSTFSGDKLSYICLGF